jgi:hypothetical protein
MEWWNIGTLLLKGNISLINSLVNPAHSGTNKPLFQFPRTHNSIIPSFQYSIIPWHIFTAWPIIFNLAQRTRFSISE